MDQPTKTFDRLVEVAATQHGFLTTANADDLGIPQAYLRRLAQTSRAQQRYRGIYRLTAIPVTALDEFHEAVLWAGEGAAVGGEAALDLWELADVNPRQIDVVVPRGRRVRRHDTGRFRVRNRNLRNRDFDFVDGVPVVTPAIAIAQVIDDGLERGLIEQAIAKARRREVLDERTEARLRVALEDRRLVPKTKRMTAV
jgi:predicted transcriptional regulator of viral defense system